MAAAEIFLLKFWNKTVLIMIILVEKYIIIRFLKYCHFNILDLHMAYINIRKLWLFDL